MLDVTSTQHFSEWCWIFELHNFSQDFPTLGVIGTRALITSNHPQKLTLPNADLENKSMMVAAQIQTP
jgi:hypothetical protein